MAAYDSAIGAGDATDANVSPWTFVFYALSMVLTMCASLAVWPGVTAFFCSVDNPATSSPCAPRGAHHGIWGRLTGDLFVPLTFVAFGVGDLLGRIASSWGPWGRRPPAPASLLLYALLRFGVAGGILVCNVVTPAPWKLPVLVHTDYASLGLILLLGLTQVGTGHHTIHNIQHHMLFKQAPFACSHNPPSTIQHTTKWLCRMCWPSSHCSPHVGWAYKHSPVVAEHHHAY